MATNTREKAAKRKTEQDRRPKATAKYVRISCRKVKIVLDLIRGKSIPEAQAILMYTPKAASEIISKVLNSAVANAEYTQDADRDSLYVAAAYANQGPSLKRYRPRAQGRAFKILKRTSHITIILDQAS
ncbi:MAG: 50S ribosomal protein L22 [Christensenellales bacterium]|jgi:large subunit ribosomal protein L22